MNVTMERAIPRRAADAGEEGGHGADGLRGDDIPLAAQVVGIADVYDALVNDRSYKKAIPGETALEMISRGDCGCFNPILIECLKDIKEKLTLDIYG